MVIFLPILTHASSKLHKSALLIAAYIQTPVCLVLKSAFLHLAGISIPSYLKGDEVVLTQVKSQRGPASSSEVGVKPGRPALTPAPKEGGAASCESCRGG